MDAELNKESGLHPLNELAIAILKFREYKRLISFSFGAILIVSCTAYLIAIYPVFLPADATNPAVAKLVDTDEYRENTKDVFERLDRYNSDNTGIANEPLLELTHSETPQFGVLVTFHLKRVPQEQSNFKDCQNLLKAEKIKYRYESNYRVTPYLPPLYSFLASELIIMLGLGFVVFYKKPLPQREAEDDLLSRYFSLDRVNWESGNETQNTEEQLLAILDSFYEFCILLNRRSRKGRRGISINDEYDVQDILFAVLRLHFSNVKREEPTPNHLGASARIDFLLPSEKICIEVKTTKTGLRDRRLGDECASDILRYPKHTDCKKIIYFVYDPDHLIENPVGFRSELLGQNTGTPIEVVFSPPRR